MNDIRIKIDHLNKVYRLYEKPIDRLKEALSPTQKIYHKEHYALNDISFELKAGEILGLVGTNGSGKSTLLKVITGVLTPSQGEVVVNGSISALLELGTGFNPEYTGIENIYLYGTMLNKSKEEIEKEIPEILEFASIGEFIHQPIKTYSSGMFARLAFSVAINVKPEILIVDEILAVGDLNFQIKCMKKMKEMMGNGTTVLFVTHDINAIKRFCTSCIWLSKGRVVEYGDVNKVTDHYLDFLKIDGDGYEIEENAKNKQLNEEEGNDQIKEEFEPVKGIIAEVKRIAILDKNNEKRDEVYSNQICRVEVIYDVYETQVEKPVLGIAIRSIDDEYICGLNTLLDEVSIPWEYGRNRFYLEYTQGILSVGGRYYLDVALFEETATVPIQYVTKALEFEILSGYIGEGKYIAPHQWRK